MDDETIRLAIAISAIIGIVLWIGWMGYSRRRRLYSIVPLSYLLHLLVFSVLASLNLLGKELYIVWKDAVILHGVVLLIIAPIIMIFEREPS